MREWVKQAEVDRGERGGLSTEERNELTELRRENRQLREDVAILKRATAFFAFCNDRCAWRVGSFFRCLRGLSSMCRPPGAPDRPG